MPILSPIGRRHWKTRMIIGLMYAALVAGAVTMVYPFLLLLAGSAKSAVDASDQRVVPAFLVDETALYRKHMEGLFNESLNSLRWAYDCEASTFERVTPPAGGGMPSLVADWREFLKLDSLPAYSYELGYLAAPRSRGTIPSSLRQLKGQMEKTYGDDIAKLNEALGTTFVGWNAFFVLPKNGLERRVKGGDQPFDRAVELFAAQQTIENRYYFNAEGFYKEAFLKNLYTRDIAEYNKASGTAYRSWKDVHLGRRLADLPRAPDLEKDNWERFVRGVLSLVWVRADSAAGWGYRDFLQAKYGTIGTFNQRYGTAFVRFELVPFPAQPPLEGVGLSDWESYLQGWHDPVGGKLYRLPSDYLYVDTVEFRFRDWLQKKYGTVAAFNVLFLGARNQPTPTPSKEGISASEEGVRKIRLPSSEGLGVGSVHSWLDILPPQQEFHFQAFKAQVGPLRHEFLTRNFRSVGDYMLRHGRAVVNTAIYCGLAVLCALIFNPLAAYALSRYRPRSTYKLLLFLMVTMAFPPMVTQIPVFLMLREFHLLNTFAALVLPGLANGYSIFLLKGFFDSLPKELYECAQLDGAGEFRLFWQITLRLSTPILAVVALGAFTAAYTNFMMALLLCQDERMWTIMPWLYQLQSTSGQGVVFASLILASIPTLLVFVFCQKVIMRGIVVPVEK